VQKVQVQRTGVSAVSGPLRERVSRHLSARRRTAAASNESPGIRFAVLDTLYITFLFACSFDSYKGACTFENPTRQI